MIIFKKQVEAIRFSPYNAEAVGKVNGVNISASSAGLMFVFSSGWRNPSAFIFAKKSGRGERQLVKKH